MRSVGPKQRASRVAFGNLGRRKSKAPNQISREMKRLKAYRTQ